MIYCSDDVLTEILLWLPSKSLIRFKLVCKKWFSLISGQQFSLLYTMHRRRRTPPETSFLLRLPETSQYFYLNATKLVPYHFPSTLFNPTIRSFSNGLLLIQCPNLENENSPEHCYVYNPTTTECRMILLNVNLRYKNAIGLNIAFDPSKAPYYKIICVRVVKRRTSSSLFADRRQFYQIEIYDSEIKVWSLCGGPFLAPPHVDFNGGIYWNNGIHWNGVFLDFDTSVIKKHPENVFPFPQGNGIDTFVEKSYTETNSCFHYVAHFPEVKWIAVFELQNDFSEWLLKYDINLDPHFGPVSVLGFIRRDGEEKEDCMLLIHQPGKVMAYCFTEKRFKEVNDFKEDSFYKESSIQFFPRFTYQFLETLAPV